MFRDGQPIWRLPRILLASSPDRVRRAVVSDLVWPRADRALPPPQSASLRPPAKAGRLNLIRAGGQYCRPIQTQHFMPPDLSCKQRPVIAAHYNQIRLPTCHRQFPRSQRSLPSSRFGESRCAILAIVQAHLRKCPLRCASVQTRLISAIHAEIARNSPND